jgi:2-methylisocitrate lyase-like PEP mutase family enzyme
MSEKLRSLRAMMRPSSFASIAGVYDLVSARIAVSAVRLGLPDVGLLTLSENVDAVSRIAGSVDVPVIADGDDGYGNHLNTQRLIRELERGGLAGVHIEDQVFPKRCGHMVGKRIVSTKAMVQKIKAAVDARQNEDFVIIARTDAIAVEGFNAAIDRANAYREAGADVMFVEAPVDDDQIAAVPKLVGVPALFNWCYGGRSPMPEISTIRDLDYRFVLMTDVIFSIATRLQSLYRAISSDRGYGENVNDMMTVDAFNEMIGFRDVEAADNRYRVE